MRKQILAGASATGSTSTAPPPTGFFCLLILWQDMFSPMCLCLLPAGFVVQSCWLRGLPSPASLSRGESFSEKSWTDLCQVTVKGWNVIQQRSLNCDLPFVTGQECFVVVKTYLLSCLKPPLSNKVYLLIDALICWSWSDFKQLKVNQPLYIAPDLWLMTIWLLQNKMSPNVSHLLRNICMIDCRVHSKSQIFL